MYMQSMIWFIGVVEGIDDPTKQGRLRVRCLGYHTENTKTLPATSLPWATVMQPITSAAMQGIGQSPTGIVQGCHVVGFFRDGTDAQDPVVMGTLGGGSGQAPQGIYGFEDPGKKYPGTSRKDISGFSDAGSGDMNPLAKGSAHQKTVTDKEKKRTKSIDMGDKIDPTSALTWNELKSVYKPTYPYNHVMETESGHVREYDDTKDLERIHEYHKAGTFYEIDKDGNKVTRIVGSNYEIVAGSDFANVKGTVNLKIDEDCNTYIKGNWKIQVDGDKYEVVKGDTTQIVEGSVNHGFGGGADGTTTEAYTLSVIGNIDINSTTRIDLN